MKNLRELLAISKNKSTRFWFVLLLFVFLNYSNSAGAQFSWYLQNSGTTEVIKDIFFINDQEGWAVGSGGIIVHTEDGGINWTSQFSDFSETKREVVFIDTEIGWIVGDGGNVLKTTDGGITWFAVSGPLTLNLHGVYFIDDMIGWVCGTDGTAGQIFFTNDGGESWMPQTVPGSTGGIWKMDFTNALTGWAVGNDGIFFTANGGANWSLQTTPFSPCYAICMINDNEGWVAGTNGQIYMTNNAGGNWLTQNSGTSVTLWDIQFLNNMLGMAVGDAGTLLYTNDGGQNWFSSNDFSSTENFHAVELIDNYSAYIGGDVGAIYKTPSVENDLSIVAYLGLDSVCANVPTDILITVYNAGPGPIDAADFVILDDADILLTYHWEGTISAGGYQNIYLGEVWLENSGNYTGVVSGDSIESNNISYKDITVFPYTGITSGTHTICPGDSVAIFASGGLSYYWTNAGTDTLNPNQLVSPVQNQNYCVMIETEYCTVMDSVKVIADDPDCNRPVSAISPNGDGVNDYLFIAGIAGADNTVQIYNRWGDLVMSYTNYDNETIAWDGYNYGGELLDAGTYFYTYEAPLLGIQSSSFVQIVR